MYLSRHESMISSKCAFSFFVYKALFIQSLWDNIIALFDGTFEKSDVASNE